MVGVGGRGRAGPEEPSQILGHEQGGRAMESVMGEGKYHRALEMDSGNWSSSPALPLSCHVSLGKSLGTCVPQFPHL